MAANAGLGHAVAMGAVWMLLMKLAVRGIGLVSTVILARLLSPDDFGVVAIAMSFFAFVAMFGEFGFDTVLIQKQQAGKAHYDTAWTLNLGFSVLAAIGIVLLAPVVSRVYEDPRLAGIMYATAMMFVFTGGKNIGVVDFRKKLNFDREFVYETIPRFIGFFVTIPLAWYLRNYWALVIGSITLRFSQMVLSYVLHPHRPSPTLAMWRELIDFSRWLMLRHFIQFLYQRSPELIAGKMLSASAAGLVSISKELPVYAVSDVVATINRATYPGYSKIADDAARLKQLYIKVLGSVALYVVPAAFGLALLADPIVPVLLGNQWLACIPLIQLLGLASMLTALNTNTLYVFLAMGNPRISAAVSAVSVLFLIPTLFVGLRLLGITGAALAILAASAVTATILNVIMRRMLGLTWADLHAVYKRPALGTASMLALLIPLAGRLLPMQSAAPIPYLLIMAVVGAVTYAGVVGALWILDGRPDGLEAKIIDEAKKRSKRLLQRKRRNEADGDT